VQRAACDRGHAVDVLVVQQQGPGRAAQMQDGRDGLDALAGDARDGGLQPGCGQVGGLEAVALLHDAGRR
jgi:hypothetical protein